MTEYSGRYPRAGIGNVGSYQVAGHPFITGSSVPAYGETRVTFPYVAKSVTVISTSAEDLRVHFGSQLTADVITGSHFISLVDNKDSVTFATKCTEIYVSCPGASPGSFQLFAELTTIDISEMYPLTGSGLTSLT